MECLRAFDHVGFFVGLAADQLPGRASMTDGTMAQRIAQAAHAFEGTRTGIAPKSVTVVQSEGTLVITVHGALSPAERALSRTPAGAAQVQELHRQLFASGSATLRQEIQNITGVEVREATAEVDPSSGTIVAVFSSGTVVQVYLLASEISADAWSAGASGDPAGAGR
jgi:uncharacterized protein YbcI